MELVDKIQKISERECDIFRHLPYGLMIGHCSHVFRLANVPTVNPIPEEYFDAVLYGVYDSFYGGCDPDFENDEQYERHEKMVETLKSLVWITPMTDKEKRKSPYQDKTKPYLGLPEK